MMVWHKDGRYLLTSASVLIGLLFIVLLKANGVLGGSVIRTEAAALPSLVQTEQENQQLANDNEKMRQELAKYAEGNASSIADQQILDAKKNAGLTLMNGPGLRITLDDSNRQASGFDIQNYFIHEGNIRQLINFLWNGGAEAIAVNDQRVTSNTEVFCSGSYIQINGTRQMPPYIITSIGDPHNLQSALNFYGWEQLGDFQKQYGITRKLEVINQVTIPAGKIRTYHYTDPVKEGL